MILTEQRARSKTTARQREFRGNNVFSEIKLVVDFRQRLRAHEPCIEEILFG